MTSFYRITRTANYDRVPFMPPLHPPYERSAVDTFHALYYGEQHHTWEQTFWMGVPTLKCPLDLWIYQEILYECQPDVIIETGTYKGGTALYLASLCDVLGRGRIVTVDIGEDSRRPLHERITYIVGSSVEETTLQKVRSCIQSGERVMVILDSLHTQSHVRRELEAYSDLVTVDQYLVVEDTNVNGHPVCPNWGPGPWEAVEMFLAEHLNFVADRKREKFFMTFNPRGFLRKVP